MAFFIWLLINVAVALYLPGAGFLILPVLIALTILAILIFSKENYSNKIILFSFLAIPILKTEADFNRPIKLHEEINVDETFGKALAKRWGRGDKSTPINKLLKDQTEEIQKWVRNEDKTIKYKVKFSAINLSF